MDYDDEDETFKTTTDIHDALDAEESDDNDVIHAEEEDSTTTVLSRPSSSSDTTRTTNLVTRRRATDPIETTTTTYFTWRTTEYNYHGLYFTLTTADPEELAIYKAKAGNFS